MPGCRAMVDTSYRKREIPKFDSWIDEPVESIGQVERLRWDVRESLGSNPNTPTIRRYSPIGRGNGFKSRTGVGSNPTTGTISVIKG